MWETTLVELEVLWGSSGKVEGADLKEVLRERRARKGIPEPGEDDAIPDGRG